MGASCASKMVDCISTHVGEIDSTTSVSRLFDDSLLQPAAFATDTYTNSAPSSGELSRDTTPSPLPPPALAENPNIQPIAGMEEVLAAGFTRQELGAPPPKWRAIIRERQKRYDRAIIELAQRVRRRALSRQYADRSRKKIRAKRGVVEYANASLESENQKLR